MNFLGLVLGALISGGIGILVYHYQEIKKERRFLKTLLYEIKHNLEIVKRPAWSEWSKLHTSGYSASKDSGALSSLPFVNRIFNFYDEIFWMRKWWKESFTLPEVQKIQKRITLKLEEAISLLSAYLNTLGYGEAIRSLSIFAKTEKRKRREEQKKQSQKR